MREINILKFLNQLADELPEEVKDNQIPNLSSPFINKNVFENSENFRNLNSPIPTTLIQNQTVNPPSQNQPEQNFQNFTPDQGFELSINSNLNNNLNIPDRTNENITTQNLNNVVRNNNNNELNFNNNLNFDLRSNDNVFNLNNQNNELRTETRDNITDLAEVLRLGINENTIQGENLNVETERQQHNQNLEFALEPFELERNINIDENLQIQRNNNEINLNFEEGLDSNNRLFNNNENLRLENTTLNIQQPNLNVDLNRYATSREGFSFNEIGEFRNLNRIIELSAEEMRNRETHEQKNRVASNIRTTDFGDFFLGRFGEDELKLRSQDSRHATTSGFSDRFDRNQNQLPIPIPLPVVIVEDKT